MKLLVIEADPICPLGSLESPLVAAGLELVYWRTREGAPPGSLAEFAGVIALGGGANPDEDDRYPWLAAERELLATAARQRLPTLGLCLGAELLADVVGASVRRLRRPEIGWFELPQAPEARADPLAERFPQGLHTFHWHGFAFDLPPEARLLAGTGRSTQAFSWAGCAWGLQFHLEADESIIGSWIAHYDRLLREVGLDPEQMLDETRRRAPSYQRAAIAFGRAFASLVRDPARQRMAAAR